MSYNEIPSKKGNIMNPKVQKTAIKVALSIAGSALLGYIVKFSHSLDEAIDRRYETKEDEDN